MTGGGGPARRPSGTATPVSGPPGTHGLAATILSDVGSGWRAMLSTLALAPLWGLIMALSAWTWLILHGRAGTGHWGTILALYFAGGLLAFPISVFLSQGLSRRRRAETRFSSAFLCLTVLTIAATAFLFAMQYRLFFARWHAPFATRIWFYQFGFTSAGAVYQFIVMGIRLYVPVGMIALFAMSLWLTRAKTVRR